MSRNHGYNNIFDEDDDGEAIEITEEEAEASDDEGREEAAACKAAMRSVRGRHRLDEEHRRMWFRLAKKALAEGAERRSAAAAAEKARVATEEKAERDRVAREAQEQRHRERFERSMRESDERWERLNEQTRRENAAWEAGRPERERREREAAAAPRPAVPARTPTREGSPGERPPATMASSNATSARPVDKPASPATLSMSPSAPRSAGVPSRSGSSLTEQTPKPRSVQLTPPQPHRRESAHRVVTPAPTVRAPTPALAPAVTAPPRRLQPPPPVPAMSRRPAPTPPLAPPRAFTSPTTAMLTGADLAAWRSARGLTQRPAAGILGVAPSTVAKAELLPGKVLGEQLQVALAAALRG